MLAHFPFRTVEILDGVIEVSEELVRKSSVILTLDHDFVESILSNPLQFGQLVKGNRLEVIMIKFVLCDISQIFPAKQGAFDEDGNDSVVKDQPPCQKQEKNNIRNDI